MCIDTPGQHVVERTAVVLRRNDSGALVAIEARFTVALPAQGRSVLGRWVCAEVECLILRFIIIRSKGLLLMVYCTALVEIQL